MYNFIVLFHNYIMQSIEIKEGKDFNEYAVASLQTKILTYDTT